jgi:AraC-like DNA-binding protein
MVQWWHDSGGVKFGLLRRNQRTSGDSWQTPEEKAVWLWLNREGMGLLWGKDERFPLHPGMFAVCGGLKQGAWRYMRQAGVSQMEVIMISQKWLLRRLGTRPEALHPAFFHWLQGDSNLAFCGLMSEWEKKLAEALDQARQGGAVDLLMAEIRLLEWAALRMFQTQQTGGSGFCHQYKNASPVEKALSYLQTHLDESLDLAALAQHVALAPHLLSRRVSQETGKPLQLHLRRFRISRACEELSSRTVSVTEAALAVGYNSLSHFTQAFRAEMGCSPGQWRKKQLLSPKV